MWCEEENIEMTHKLPEGKLFLVKKDLAQMGPLSLLFFLNFFRYRNPAIGLWAKLKLAS